ncbi:MAG: hypothetical protein WC847_01960 [Candidatus Paceibacterota bacterium]|jgi:hypothetical protein
MEFIVKCCEGKDDGQGSCLRDRCPQYKKAKSEIEKSWPTYVGTGFGNLHGNPSHWHFLEKVKDNIPFARFRDWLSGMVTVGRNGKTVTVPHHFLDLPCGCSRTYIKDKYFSSAGLWPVTQEFYLKQSALHRDTFKCLLCGNEISTNKK